MTKEQLAAPALEAANDENVVPWSGYMSVRELKKPGGKLLGALLGCAEERDIKRGEMADKLGVTPGYISQLRTGERETRSISLDFGRAGGKYLGVSLVEVLALAGALDSADFVDAEGNLADVGEVLAKAA